MADNKAPVNAPVEPTTRRGRRKMEDVAALAARGAVETANKANEAKAKARTKTAVLTEQEKQDALLAQKRERKAAASRKKRQQQWADFKVRAASALRVGMVVGPITAPMVVSWTGQSGFATGVLGWNFLASLLYAAAYELTTVFAAWMYHEAKKDGDKGWEYRVATWMFAAGAGAQQWWHYSDNWHATPRAVTYSTMTAIGVVVWELYARLIHRRKLRADGKLTGARPRIGSARWLRYPRISWTAWSASVKHNFTEFESMWTFAEIETDRKRIEKDRVRTLRNQVKDLKQQVADLTPSKSGRKVTAKIDRVDLAEVEQTPVVATPDPEPVNAGPLPAQKALEAGPRDITSLDGGSQEEIDEPEFTPTAAEIQALEEMVEQNIRINRTEVAAYIREHRSRLGQDGIATKRAAEVAAWGKWNAGKKTA